MVFTLTLLLKMYMFEVVNTSCGPTKVRWQCDGEIKKALFGANDVREREAIRWQNQSKEKCVKVFVDHIQVVGLRRAKITSIIFY